MKKIILTGGSGFIGTHLIKQLIDEGYDVCVLDIVAPRYINERVTFVKHDIVRDVLSPEIISGSFGVIHLAGIPIFHRWTSDYKKNILDSRIISTQKIVQAISQCAQKPEVFVCASAVGYYGDSNELLTEDSPNGKDFLSYVCKEWEKEATKAVDFGLRVVCLRTANVFGKGGMIGVLEPLFKKWIGGYFGSGAHYMPWVHYKDIVSMYSFSLSHPLSGSYNTSAGEPVTQKYIMKSIATILKVPVVWRIPVWFVRILYGEFSTVFTINQKISSKKIKDAGYVFHYEIVNDALQDVLSH